MGAGAFSHTELGIQRPEYHPNDHIFEKRDFPIRGGQFHDGGAECRILGCGEVFQGCYGQVGQHHTGSPWYRVQFREQGFGFLFQSRRGMFLQTRELASAQIRVGVED